MKIKKILTIVLAIMLIFPMVTKATAIDQISSDTLLKYYADSPNSANDNLIIEEVSNPAIDHGFSLTVKTTAESTWANPQDCYYSIWIVPGDARPEEKREGNSYGIDLSLGGSIDGVLNNTKRCLVVKPSYTGANVLYSTAFPGSSAGYSEATYMGLKGIAPPAGTVFALDFDLEEWASAAYSNSNRYYTIIVQVNDTDRTTFLGCSDFYTMKLGPATTGTPDTISYVYPIALVGEPINVAIIAIAGASALALLGLIGAIFLLKRKKRMKNQIVA